MLHPVNPNYNDRYLVYFDQANTNKKITLYATYGSHPDMQIVTTNLADMYNNLNYVYTPKQLKWVVPSLKKYQKSHKLGRLHVVKNGDLKLNAIEN